MKKLGLILLVVWLTNACRKDDITTVNEPNRYSFFVAGHTYGSPSDYVGGIYSPFKSKFSYINNDSDIQMGFLTGDIVKYSTDYYWDIVDADLSLLNVPVHFVAGNHEAQNMPLFNSRYGNSFYSFELNGDLFIVLDGNLDGWRITGDQLSFLETVLSNNTDLTQKVFIFVHQVIYFDIFPVSYHSEEGLISPLNFETEVLPILEATHKKTYLFAGDVGAFDWGASVFYDKKKNVTYISSGMGGGVDDNFVIVDVYDDNSLGFRLISLNGDNINALGKLTDY